MTGVDGYLGGLLAALLVEDGHDVLGVDTGYYRSGWLYDGVRHSPRTLSRDIRALTAADLDGVEAVVHLAELSNDPVGDLLGTVTYDINHLGSVHLARLAKEAGASRFVTRPPAASTASPRGRSTSRARSPRRRRTRAARSSSSATSGRWPTTRSRRRSCATPRPSAPPRGCASTSC